MDGKLKGYTALTWAAEQGYEKMVDFLISKGANVNARQDSDVNNGATVLMRAAIKGKFNIKADHKAVPALGFQIHVFQKYFSSNERGEYDLKIEKNTKCSSFYLFFKEIYTSNVLFYCICLIICAKSMGSGTLL